MKQLLDKPLPADAVKPHPTKNFLSTINAIYVTERLNDVFGVGSWRIKTEVVTEKTSTVRMKSGEEKTVTMVVTKTIFEIPEYDIHYECYGGNDNDDLGDAYKGSVTDALTKIGSYLGIGADVWKDKQQKQTSQQRQRPVIKQKSQPSPEERRANAVKWLGEQPANVLQKAMAANNITDLERCTLEEATRLYKYIKTNIQ